VFNKTLLEKFERIFQFKKTTFDAPSDSFEQDTLFIEVDKATTRVSDGKLSSRIDGTLIVYSQANKLPFGYFNKAIAKGKLEDVRDLFFFDIDVDVASSTARLQNIHERRTRFVYLHKEQYDPNKGQLNTLNFGDC
jgi:hypothetical protein